MDVAMAASSLNMFEEDSLCFPPLPGDLDDLLSDDLMAFLKAADIVPEASAGPSLPALSTCSGPGHLLSGLAPQQQQQQAQKVPQASVSRAPSPPLPPAAPGTVTSLQQRPVSNKPATSQKGVKRTVTTELPPGSSQQQQQQASKKAAVAPTPAAMAPVPMPVAAPAPPAAAVPAASPAPVPAPVPVAVPAAPAPKPAAPSKVQQQPKVVPQQQAAQAQSNDDDSSLSDDSADTEEDMECNGQAKVNKRKAPEIDWKSITDPAERRRQRRLAKNRVTAARSRERKKAQWAELEERLNGLESENQHLKALLEKFSRENSQLRDQLAQVTRGASPNLRGSNAEPAVLIFIATLLVLACFVPTGDRLALLGSSLPLILAAVALREGNSQQPLSEMLMRMLMALKTLVSKCGRAARTSMQRLLFQRHYYVGRKALQKLGTVASTFDPLGLASKIKLEEMVS